MFRINTPKSIEIIELTEMDRFERKESSLRARSRGLEDRRPELPLSLIRLASEFPRSNEVPCNSVRTVSASRPT